MRVNVSEVSGFYRFVCLYHVECISSLRHYDQSPVHSLKHSLGLGRDRCGLMSMFRSIRLRASLFSCLSFSSIRESLCSSDDILKTSAAPSSAATHCSLAATEETQRFHNCPLATNEQKRQNSLSKYIKLAPKDTQKSITNHIFVYVFRRIFLFLINVFLNARFILLFYKNIFFFYRSWHFFLTFLFVSMFRQYCFLVDFLVDSNTQ